MKAFLCLAIISTICCLAYSAVAKTKEENKIAVEKCSKEFQVEDKHVAQVLKMETLPDQQNVKCMIACYMKEVGLFHSGNFDLEALKERDKTDRKDPVLIEKAAEIDKKCAEKVAGEKDECKLAHNFLACAISDGKAAGIPSPNVL